MHHMRRQLLRSLDHFVRIAHLCAPVPVANPGRSLTPRERALYREKRALGAYAIDAFGQALYLRDDR